jgi:hypothetical protein
VFLCDDIFVIGYCVPLHSAFLLKEISAGSKIATWALQEDQCTPAAPSPSAARDSGGGAIMLPPKKKVTHAFISLLEESPRKFVGNGLHPEIKKSGMEVEFYRL